MNQTDPKLFCLHFNECDITKCTALKLKRLNLVTIITKIKGGLNNAIALNPFSNRELTIDDREVILKFGIIVIDCSWNRIFEFKKFNFRISRKLPPMIATNPTNYGKWEKLSSVEALAGALYVTNFISKADLILSKFQWGSQFKKLNGF